jgi:hypothetical protein
LQSEKQAIAILHPLKRSLTLAKPGNGHLSMVSGDASGVITFNISSDPAGNAGTADETM